MTDKYGDCLTWDQFRKVMQQIEDKNSFRKAMGRNIKYVRPDIDMRTREVFHVRFDAFGIKEAKFDFRDSEEAMFDRIMDWLD